MVGALGSWGAGADKGAVVLTPRARILSSTVLVALAAGAGGAMPARATSATGTRDCADRPLVPGPTCAAATCAR